MDSEENKENKTHLGEVYLIDKELIKNNVLMPDLALKMAYDMREEAKQIQHDFNVLATGKDDDYLMDASRFLLNSYGNMPILRDGDVKLPMGRIVEKPKEEPEDEPLLDTACEYKPNSDNIFLLKSTRVGCWHGLDRHNKYVRTLKANGLKIWFMRFEDDEEHAAIKIDTIKDLTEI